MGATPAPTSNNGRAFYWKFTNVAPGPHSLTMTALVKASFSGTQLVNWAFLKYTTVVGHPLVGSTVSAAVEIPAAADTNLAAEEPVIILQLNVFGKKHT